MQTASQGRALQQRVHYTHTTIPTALSLRFVCAAHTSQPVCGVSAQIMLLSRLVSKLGLGSNASHYNLIVFQDGQPTGKLFKQPRQESLDLLFAAVRDQLGVKQPRLFIGARGAWMRPGRQGER